VWTSWFCKADMLWQVGIAFEQRSLSSSTSCLQALVVVGAKVIFLHFWKRPWMRVVFEDYIGWSVFGFLDFWSLLLHATFRWCGLRIRTGFRWFGLRIRTGFRWFGLRICTGFRWFGLRIRTSFCEFGNSLSSDVRLNKSAETSRETFICGW
jgi:hypothetical protein